MNGISVVSATLVGYFHVLLSRPRFCGQRIQFPKQKPKQFIESNNTKGVDEKNIKRHSDQRVMDIILAPPSLQPINSDVMTLINFISTLFVSF